jgi:integrase
MKGIDKRCGCRDDSGVKLGARCPLLQRAGHGAYGYRIDLGPGLDGAGVFRDRRQEYRGGFARKKDAEHAKSEHLVRIKRGEGQARSGMTCAEWWSQWLEGKVALRANTRRAYEAHIRLHLRPHLGHVRLQDLDAGHIERMYAAIRTDNARKAAENATKIETAARTGNKADRTEPTMGPASIQRLHATLRSALNTAVKRRLLPFNPAQHVELEAAPRPHVSPWSAQELGQFLDATATDRLGCMYEVMAFAGLRRGEAVGLRWCDVDLEDAVIHIRQEIVDVGSDLVLDKPKTKDSEGRVDVDGQTVGSLLAHQIRQHAERAEWAEARIDWRAYFRARPAPVTRPDGKRLPGRIGLLQHKLLPDCDRQPCSHELVFCRQDGRPLRPEYVTRHMQALAAESGLPRKRLHDLRHGSASLQIAAGVDLAIVSKRLRHSSVSITADTYTHLLQGVGRQAAEAAASMVPRAGRAESAQVFQDHEDTMCTPSPENDSGLPLLGEKAQVRGGAPSGT